MLLYDFYRYDEDLEDALEDRENEDDAEEEANDEADEDADEDYEDHEEDNDENYEDEDDINEGDDVLLNDEFDLPDATEIDTGILYAPSHCIAMADKVFTRFSVEEKHTGNNKDSQIMEVIIMMVLCIVTSRGCYHQHYRF